MKGAIFNLFEQYPGGWAPPQRWSVGTDDPRSATVRVASALAAQLVIDHHGVDPIWAMPLIDDPELRTAPWWNRAVNAIVDVHGEYADSALDESAMPQEALLL